MVYKKPHSLHLGINSLYNTNFNDPTAHNVPSFISSVVPNIKTFGTWQLVAWCNDFLPKWIKELDKGNNEVNAKLFHPRYSWKHNIERMLHLLFLWFFNRIQQIAFIGLFSMWKQLHEGFCFWLQWETCKVMKTEPYNKSLHHFSHRKLVFNGPASLQLSLGVTHYVKIRLKVGWFFGGERIKVRPPHICDSPVCCPLRDPYMDTHKHKFRGM